MAEATYVLAVLRVLTERPNRYAWEAVDAGRSGRVMRRLLLRTVLKPGILMAAIVKYTAPDEPQSWVFRYAVPGAYESFICDAVDVNDTALEREVEDFAVEWRNEQDVIVN